MKNNFRDYSIFHDFIKAYLPVGFNGINRKDELMLRIEEVTEANDQFISVLDTSNIKTIFTSNRSSQMIGIAPDELNPTNILNQLHPDDVYRYCMGRTKLMSVDKDIYTQEKGDVLLSSNFRFKRPDKAYSEHLVQCYMFFSTVPHKSVYLFKVHTNIDWYRKSKNGFHYYTGDDMSNFRYPDKDLLTIGNPLSTREFELIKLIKQGLTNDEISDRLFISVNTIKTHRRNIIDKCGKFHLSDVIFDLIDQGLL